MNKLVKKNSLQERIKNIQKELKEVKKVLNKFPSNINSSVFGKKNVYTTETSGVTEDRKQKNIPLTPLSAAKVYKTENVYPTVNPISRRLIRDERFADYLATNIEPVQPLRYHRRRQRNKVLILLLIIILILLWLIGSRLY